jgi:hypothetical protein
MVNKINKKLQWMVQVKRDGRWYNSDRFECKKEAKRDVLFRSRLTPQKHRVVKIKGR